MESPSSQIRHVHIGVINPRFIVVQHTVSHRTMLAARRRQHRSKFDAMQSMMWEMKWKMKTGWRETKDERSDWGKRVYEIVNIWTWPRRCVKVDMSSSTKISALENDFELALARWTIKVCSVYSRSLSARRRKPEIHAKKIICLSTREAPIMLKMSRWKPQDHITLTVGKCWWFIDFHTRLPPKKRVE